MNASLGTIASRMKLSFFSRNQVPAEGSAPVEEPRPITGGKFPADEVAWGIAIRNGFDELDDPWHHRGLTQHAYLESNDNTAICGFRPAQSGPRTRRRARLGMPTTGEHPMCGICARMVVAPRPRVPVTIQPSRPVAMPVNPARPAVAVPVAPQVPAPVTAASVGAAPIAANGAPGLVVPPAPPQPVAPQPPQAVAPSTTRPDESMSPWVQRIEGDDTIQG
jgi:hypothetical protein